MPLNSWYFQKEVFESRSLSKLWINWQNSQDVLRLSKCNSMRIVRLYEYFSIPHDTHFLVPIRMCSENKMALENTIIGHQIKRLIEILSAICRGSLQEQTLNPMFKGCLALFL